MIKMERSTTHPWGMAALRSLLPEWWEESQQISFVSLGRMNRLDNQTPWTDLPSKTFPDTNQFFPGSSSARRRTERAENHVSPLHPYPSPYP